MKKKSTLKEFNEDTRELFRNVNTAYALKNRDILMKAITKANKITEKYRKAKQVHLQDGGQENPIDYANYKLYGYFKSFTEE